MKEYKSLNYIEIGERIRTYRKRKNLSQEKLLANLAEKKLPHFGRNTLSALENGNEEKINAVTLPQWDALCSVFGCSIGSLLGEYECETYDNQFIKDKTRLSETSIKNLCRSRGRGNLFLDELISSQYYFEIEHLYEQVLDAIKYLNSCMSGMIECENKATTLNPDSQEYAENDKMYFKLQHSAMRWDSESKTNIYDMGRIFLNIFEDIRKNKIKQFSE